VLAGDLTQDLGLFGLLLMLKLHALGVERLLDFFGLTSHGRLVAKQLGALKEVAIYWDVHTVIELNDVTNVQVVVMEDNHLAVTKNGALYIKLDGVERKFRFKEHIRRFELKNHALLAKEIRLTTFFSSDLVRLLTNWSSFL
jgi:hypothetical protein